MRRLPRWIIPAFFLLGACARGRASRTAIGPANYYTLQEKKGLTMCSGIADTVLNVAIQKLDGVPKKNVQKFYANKPYSELNLAAVDRVYDDQFSLAWDYVLFSFYPDCATNVAQVPPNRTKLAGYCMQTQLIVDAAYAHKTSGRPKEATCAQFAKLNGDLVKSTTDKVYASSKNRADILAEAWDDCMSPISGG